MENISVMLGAVTAIAFVVNIIVQVTKDSTPIPTKLWCIIVSEAVTIAALYVASAKGYAVFDLSNFVLSLAGALIVAYISMNGFDTFKELWERFKEGEDIDE